MTTTANPETRERELRAQIENLGAAYAEKHEELHEARAWNAHLDDVLAALRDAARRLTDLDPPPGASEEFCDALIDLVEVIPCEDCYCAPCRCPND